MTKRSDDSADDDSGCAAGTGPDSTGLGGFLRGLLSGIPWSESVSSEETFTLPAPHSHQMSIHNANGKTRVVGEDREGIEVVATMRARAESVEAANEVLDRIEIVSSEVAGVLELDVEASSRWNRHASADLFVRVPRATEMTVVAANGKLCLEGLRGHVQARSSNGAVSISDIVGDIEVFTSNAKVTCDCTCGRLKARSSNSRIQLDGHRGSLDASTSNGVIHVVLSELGNDGVALATSNGRILLELPDDVNADVDVRVDNGVIRNALEVDTRFQDDRRGRLRGKLGRGGPAIKLRTSNGTISLR